MLEIPNMGKEIKTGQEFNPAKELVKKETIGKIIDECRRFYSIVPGDHRDYASIYVEASSDLFGVMVMHEWHYDKKTYNINIFARRDEDFLPKPLRYSYDLNSNGDLTASCYITYWIRDGLKGKPETEIEFINEKIEWFRSQGKIIGEKSEKYSPSLEKFPVIIPSESHACKVLGILSDISMKDMREEYARGF